MTHLRNSKSGERWYYFSSTSLMSGCLQIHRRSSWSRLMTVLRHGAARYVWLLAGLDSYSNFFSAQENCKISDISGT